ERRSIPDGAQRIVARPVGCQSYSIRPPPIDADKCGHSIRDQSDVLLRRHENAACAWFSRLFPTGINLSIAVTVDAGVDRVAQDTLDGVPRWRSPFQRAATRAVVRPDADANAVAHQVSDDTAHAADSVELVEDHADYGLDLLVRIDDELATRLPDVADRRQGEEIPAASFVQSARIHSAPQDVQLGLRHRALQAQQQSVIVIGRIIQAVLVGEQSPKDGAQLQ